MMEEQHDSAEDLIGSGAMESAPPRKKGSFVTPVGWAMLVYGLLGALAMAVVYVIVPDLGYLLDGAKPRTPDAKWLVTFITFLLRNLHAILLYAMASSLLLAFTGATLLLRKEWGRKLAVGLLAWQCVTGVLTLVALVPVYMDMIRIARPDAVFGTIVGAVGGLFGSVPWLALYGYAAWKLTRPDVREEFIG